MRMSVKTHTVEPKTTEPAKKKKSMRERIAGLGAWVVGGVIGYALGLAVFILLIGVVIGNWFPSWYVKRNKSTTLPNFIAWANVISWLIPIVGVTTATMTYRFTQYIEPEHKMKYRILATIAAVLAVGNAFLASKIQY